MSAKTALTWDLVNNQIVTAAVAGFAGTDTAITALAYASDVTIVTTASMYGLTTGQYVKISGIAPSAYNGTVVVLSVSNATTFTYTSATVPGSVTTTQGVIGAITPSDVTLSVKVLAVEVGNSETVTYDNSISFLTRNNNGSCALVLL